MTPSVVVTAELDVVEAICCVDGVAAAEALVQGRCILTDGAILEGLVTKFVAIDDDGAACDPGGVLEFVAGKTEVGAVIGRERGEVAVFADDSGECETVGDHHVGEVVSPVAVIVIEFCNEAALRHREGSVQTGSE